MPALTQSISPAWFTEKDCLQRLKTYILQKDLERHHKFDPQEPVGGLLKERSVVIDEILTLGWQHFLSNQAEKQCLIAVGGYGRQELFPHSDIDILILTDSHIEPIVQERITNFSVFLWDIGLKPGLSVRTVEECVTEAIEDQTVMTCILENRLITGNSELYQTFKNEITTDKIWPSDRFFAAKMVEMQKRHTKYHGTAYNSMFKFFKFSSLEFNPQLCTVAKRLVPCGLNPAQPYVYRKALTETHRQPVRPILSVYPLGCDAPVGS
jgi:[protein-PII] uridylyltransferase